MVLPRDMPALGRRTALTGAAGLLAAMAAPAVTPGLNVQAMAGNRFYGAAIADHVLATDAAYMASVREECGIVTGETAFKWGEAAPQSRCVELAPGGRADGVRRPARHPGPRPYPAVA